jgi:ERCC4-type nuclease
MNCSIITDYREHTCIENFEGLGVETATENLDVGDFWIVDEDRKPLVIIERKRIDDFASSLTSGRLHEQKHRLLTNVDTSGAKIVYILEGNLVYENQRIKGKSAAPLYSALWSITFGTDIDLFQTKNAYHTCMCIESICKKIRKKGKFWNTKLTRETYEKVLSSKKKNNDNPEQCAKEMLCCIRGVSHSVATVLLEEFGNIPRLCEVVSLGGFKERAAVLKTVTKSGKKRAIPKTVIGRIEKYLSSENGDHETTENKSIQ